MIAPPPHAFTLMELFVGIGFIGVLMAIFLPALSLAREPTGGTACL